MTFHFNQDHNLGYPLAVLTGHHGGVTLVRFSQTPSDRSPGSSERASDSLAAISDCTNRYVLSSASYDGTCRLWIWGRSGSVEDTPDIGSAIVLRPGSGSGSDLPEGGAGRPSGEGPAATGVGRRTDQPGSLISLSVSPDGRFVAAGGDNCLAFVWCWAASRSDVLPSGPAELRGHSRPVHLIEFSPDGQLLATASSDGSLRVRSSLVLLMGLMRPFGDTGPFDL